jgi:Leucine-rich repeat (LRR) protein
MKFATIYPVIHLDTSTNLSASTSQQSTTSWLVIQLQELSLSGNRLKSLPQQIDKLDLVSTLRLGFNQLEFTPPEIYAMKNIKFLTIEGNPSEFSIERSLIDRSVKVF